MRLVFTPNGRSDDTHWLSTDRRVLERINRLLDDVLRPPRAASASLSRSCTCVPAGTWSRRITGEHRLVYLVDGDDVVILAARFLYS